MSTKITRWKLDTCGCVVDMAWDDSSDPATRTYTVDRVIEKCEYHEHLDDENTFIEVRSENNLMNRTMNAVREASGKTLDEILEKTTYSFDEDRKLVMEVEGVSAQEILDAKALIPDDLAKISSLTHI